MLTRVVKMQFETGFIAEFKILFKAVNQKIANFEGCKGVKLLQHEVDPSIFFTISNWESATYLDHYRNSELFKTTWAEVKPHFVEKAEAWSLLEQ
jgi:heme-degrading monooxygenase HmoA